MRPKSSVPLPKMYVLFFIGRGASLELILSSGVSCSKMKYRKMLSNV